MHLLHSYRRNARRQVLPASRLECELDIDRRTIVFFASDNGHSSHGYDRDKSVLSIGEQFQNFGPTRGRKGDSYDGAFRIPAMARWTGKIKAGQISDQIWAFWDFLPTAAELAGAEFSSKIDGISITPTLLGKPNEQQEHEYLYWEFNQKQAVRAGRWFAHRKSGGPVELPVKVFVLLLFVGFT